MSKHSQKFQPLKASWGLAESTSAEDLLSHAKRRLIAEPNNPELIYTLAEIQRHLGNTDDAVSEYKNAISASEVRTEQRGELLETRIDKLRDHTQAKFLLFTFVPLIVVAFLIGIAWETLNKPAPLPEGGDPNKFAFTEWLAKQQMVQIMTTLQQQNPELTFDFSRPSASAQSPMEFMQSLMQANAIEKMKQAQKKANSKDAGGDGLPAFQCSKEAPVQCSARDIPSAAGEKREEVLVLMEAYRSILSSERDCEKLEQSIETFGQQLQWRKSERRIKADLEDFAVECFYREKNVEKTIEHARKLLCTGDEGYINSVYWYTTAITHHAGDTASAETAYQCFQEATTYIKDLGIFSEAYTAARQRESGALAWLYFNDLDKATEELQKARASLKRIDRKTPTMLEVAGEIDLDLLETYVTANTDQDTFEELITDINSSGRLTDGYKQIKDTLTAIYYMQNNKPKPALVALTNISSRFKLMPEFICGWDWSGFKRGLQDSITDDEIRKQAIVLVDTANCYTPQSMQQRIKNTNNVAKWLRAN